MKFFEEMEHLPKGAKREDVLNYFFLPEFPPYNPKIYRTRGEKPLMLILRNDPTKHFTFNGQEHSKSPLADIFYDYLKDEFEIVYESDPMASLQDIVDKKLGGEIPEYVLYGYTYHYGILIDPEYMKRNDIRFIFTLGDIECYQNQDLPKLIMERIECDYLLSHITDVEWEINNMRRNYGGIRNSILIEIPWCIDERYIQKKERDIDISFICSYDDDSGYHDKRADIKRIIDDIPGLNVVTGEYYGDEYIDILNRSKIFIVEPSMRGVMVQKYLEGAACGAMMMGEIPNNSFFEDGLNMVHIPNGDYERLLKKKILYYIEQDIKIWSIAESSRELVLKNYHAKDISRWFGKVVKKSIVMKKMGREKTIVYKDNYTQKLRTTGINSSKPKKIALGKNIVFLCLHDWASVSTRLSEAINKYTDWNARCICKYPNPFGYPNDLLERDENKEEIRRVMNKADVIIWGSSFYGYKPFGIGPKSHQFLGIWHGGSDYRKRYKMFNSEIHHMLDFVFTHRDLEELDDYNIRLQVPFNCEDYVVPKRDWNGKIRIGHSPSSRAKKGTNYFLKAAEMLKKDFPGDVEIVLLENMTTKQVLKEKERLHIFFDQIGGVAGYTIPVEDGGNCGYGLSLVESATLGTICLSWSDYSDTPILCVKNENDIYSTVSNLLKNRKKMKELSKNTRNWVIKEHGYQNISRYFIAIMENLTQNKDRKYKRVQGMVHGKGFINPLGEKGVCWVRDVPKAQCDKYSATSIPCEKFFTMSDRIANLACRHIFNRDVPYELFLNYPDYRYTPDEKRDEMVYVDNSSISYANYGLIIDILNGIYDSTGIQTIFISTRFHSKLSNMDVGNVKVIHKSEYDYRSRYGLLVGAMKNKYYASISLPRKLLYYLSWGMVPLIHEDFSSAIGYCIKNDANHLVYDKPKDLKGINLYPSHIKYEYTFEYNYPRIYRMIWGDDLFMDKNNIRADDLGGII